MDFNSSAAGPAVVVVAAEMTKVPTRQVPASPRRPREQPPQHPLHPTTTRFLFDPNPTADALAAMVERDSVEPTTLAAMVGRDSVEPTIFDGSADVCVSRDLPLKIAQPRRLSGLGFSGQEIQSPLYGTEELCLFGGAPFVPEVTRIFSSHDIPSVKTLG